MEGIATDFDGPSPVRVLQAFWRWWTGELRALVPQGLRARLRAQVSLPVIRLQRDSVALDVPTVEGGQLRYRRIGEVPRDAQSRALDVPAARLLEPLRPALEREGVKRALVTLPAGTALCRTVDLPMAVEDELREAIEFELDRLTPFRADQVYFDAVVVDRMPAAGQCRVQLGYAPRRTIDEVVAAFSGSEVRLAGIAPEGCEASGMNLVRSERTDHRATGLVAAALPWLLLLALGIGALALPIWQKRELAIALAKEVGAAKDQALATDSLRKQVDDMESQYNFVLARKFAYPTTVQVLEELTRLFPDDTWITQLDVRTTGRGKEMQREIQLRGDTANAGRLISLLEGSSLIADAAPRSPTLKLQPGPGEAFDLGARVRNMPAPVAIRLGPPADAAAIDGAGPSSAASVPPAQAGAVAPVPPTEAGAAAPVPPTQAGAAAPASGAPARVSAKGGRT